MKKQLKKTIESIKQIIFKATKCINNNSKPTLIFLVGIFIWSIYEENFLPLFDKNILPFISDIKLSAISIIILCLLILFPIYYIIRCFKNKYLISYSSFLLLTFFVGIYTTYRISKYDAYPTIISIFGLSDIIFVPIYILLIISIISYINSLHIEKKEQPCKLISDDPIITPEEDILDYNNSAKSLVDNTIKTIKRTKSFSIGINAPWGTGKTSYINLIKYNLDNDLDKNKFIIIEFNPRHSNKAENIQKDFFNAVFCKLKKYNSKFSSTFKDYLQAISIISNNMISFSIFDIYKIWDKESEKEKINNAIKKIDKRIIVIIEDLDRLLADEIIEVFKLIDGNASFSNFIFITAYDKKHINGIIEKTYLNNNSNFPDKFFTSEFQIPLRPYYYLFNYLSANLFKDTQISIENINLYKETLKNHAETIEEQLPTLRDIKRFINLFKVQFEQIEGEVEFKDFFLLYIIKYKYKEEYINLYNKNYIKEDILINSEQFVLAENINEKEIASKEILNKLFDNKKTTFRSINNTKAFNIYFYEYILNGLTIKEMKSLLSIDYNEIIIKLEEYSKTKLIEYFFRFLDSRNISNFGDKNKFERYIDLLFLLHTIYQQPAYNIHNLLRTNNKNYIIKKYNYSEEEYKELITTKLKKNYHDSEFKYPYLINKSIILGLIRNEYNEDIILNQEEVLNISKQILDNYIEINTEFNRNHLELLYCCISNFTDKVILDIESCNKVKKLIIQNPNNYFSNFIGLGMESNNPEYNSIACEGFWKQIFENKEEIERIINDLDNFQNVKNFWEIYKNNNYQPIQFERQGNVQEKINNGLVEEKNKLDELLKIEIDFNTLKENRDNDLQEYLNLQERINNNNLYISKHVLISEQIKKHIQKIEQDK